MKHKLVRGPKKEGGNDKANGSVECFQAKPIVLC